MPTMMHRRTSRDEACQSIEGRMAKDKGRIDWMLRRRMWRVIGYVGKRDVEIGEAMTKEIATKILQDWVKQQW